MHRIIEVPFTPLDSSRFDPIFNQILSMLLDKNAFLRASVSEVLEMDALRDRVEQFEQVNRDYLAAMTGATHQ